MVGEGRDAGNATVGRSRSMRRPVMALCSARRIDLQSGAETIQGHVHAWQPLPALRP